MMTEKALEQRLRRALNKQGYSLHKSCKAVGANNCGGYMIVNYYINGVVAGSDYDYSLEDVAEWLRERCEE